MEEAAQSLTFLDFTMYIQVSESRLSHFRGELVTVISKY